MIPSELNAEAARDALDAKCDLTPFPEPKTSEDRLASILEALRAETDITSAELIVTEMAIRTYATQFAQELFSRVREHD